MSNTSKMSSIQNVVQNSVLSSVRTLIGAEPSDIVTALKQDHESLRSYIDILKDTSEDMTVRRRAYRQFVDLLQSHSVAEETAVYEASREFTGRELHIKVEEGYVEHQLCDDLMARIEAEEDPLIWGAHCNVLAEILDHHLREEEDDLFPMIREKATPEQNMDMLVEFMSIRARTQKIVTEKNSGALAE